MIAPSTSTLLTSLASVIAVSQAAILSPGFTPDVDRRGLFDGPGALLQARQDNTQPNVPPECLPTCGPVNTLIQQSCPPTSCCTATFVQNYVTCFQCVGTAAGVTDYSRGQASLHILVEACNDRGLPVNEVFLPGQSPSSTTTSSSSSTEPTVITSQSTIRSLTEPITPTNTVSQNTVRGTDSSPTTTSPPSTSTSGTATGAESGAMGLGKGWATVSAWVLPLVAAGMGVVLF
ncbi:hypothetical protein MD484_g2179, partial [Candolleomyces efflorescens]